MRRLPSSRARLPAARHARPSLARAALAVLTAGAGLLAFAPPAAAGTLTNVSWTATKTTTSATGASYRFALTAATASTLSSVTMTVPPGTGGSPTVGSVTPAALAGGAVSLGSNALTYTFIAASVAAGQAISIAINGLTNTSSAGPYTSTVTTRSGASSVDSGTSSTVTITSGSLTSPTWTASSTTTGAAPVSYTYGFSNLLSAFTSLTMTVPPGTSGTPAIGTTSGITIGSVSLSGTTLTVSVLSVNLGAVAIQITGLTNTGTAGAYPSEIVATPALGSPASGVTAALTFSGGLALTSPGSLGWSGVAGSTQSLTDTTSGDQQFSVDDETGSGAGWHIAVAATTFSNGIVSSLANSGTFVVTGSLTSAAAITAPTATCAPSCTPPVTSVSYPVAVTTAATSPTPVSVFAAAAGSGVGPVTIGGHSAANPLGWWISVPATARAGSYTSTITISVVSGP